MKATMAPASRKASSLPLELLDIVVDYLHDDPTSLLACSLVSHALLHYSRHHSFSHLCSFQITHCGSEADFEELSRVLRTSVFVCQYVQELDVSGHISGSNSPQLSALVLAPILESLPNVKRVWLSGFFPKENTHTPFEHIGRFNLDRLSLSYIGIDSSDAPKAILELLSLFGRVGEFDVDEIREDRSLLFAPLDMKRWDQFSPPPQFAVRRLTMSTPWVPTTELLIALRKTPTIHSLEEIDVLCDGIDSAIALGTLVQTCTRLQHLRFNLFELLAGIWIPEIAQLQGYKVLNLATCATLESFRVWLGKPSATVWQSDIFEACLDLLLTLPPNTREVVLESSTTFEDVYLAEDDALRNSLVESLNSIPSLRSVTLLLPDSGRESNTLAFDRLRDNIRSNLTDLHPNLMIRTQ